MFKVVMWTFTTKETVNYRNISHTLLIGIALQWILEYI